MRSSTIHKNTPISRRKARLFRRLVFFYQLNIVSRLELTDMQREIKLALSAYENEHHRIPDFSKVELDVLDKSQFEKYVPCHRRKRAMFYALLVFLDEHFSQLNVNEDFDKNVFYDKIIGAYNNVLRSIGYYDGDVDYRDTDDEDEDIEDEYYDEETEKDYRVTLDFNGNGNFYVSAKNKQEAEQKVFDEVNDYLKNKFNYYKIENVDADLDE